MFARIDMRESIRRKAPVFITFKRFARIASKLRLVIFTAPKRDSQRKFNSGTLKRFARIGPSKTLILGRIFFPNFVERSILKLPLSKLCAVPFAPRSRALFWGEKRAKSRQEKGRKRGGQQRGQKEKRTRENNSEGVWTSFLPVCPSLNGTESRIANRTIPRIVGLQSPEIPQREAKKKKSNRSKTESQKIDSESPSESHPINAESDLGSARF